MGVPKIPSSVESRILLLSKIGYSGREIRKKLKKDNTEVALATIYKWIAVANGSYKPPIYQKGPSATYRKRKKQNLKSGTANNTIILPEKQAHNLFCIICTESMTQLELEGSLPSKPKRSFLNFEDQIKSFCKLLSLTLNCFQVDLKVSNSVLKARLCSNCRQNMECIGTIFREIDKLQRKLNELKESVEKQLTRVTSQNFDDEDVFAIRKQLQQKLQIYSHDSEGSSESLIKLEFIAEDDETADHIDANNFDDDSAPASPLNLNYKDEVHDAVTEPDSFWSQNSIDETVIETNNDQEILTKETETVKTSLNLSELLETNKTETHSASKNLRHSISSSSNDAEEAPSKFVEAKSSSSWGPKLTSKELSLVQNAHLKDFSINVLRLDIPARCNLKRGKSAKKIFTCEHCNRVCLKHSNLLHHKSLAHPEIHPFVCNICKKGFNKETIYERHKKFHANDDKYSCHACPAVFTKKQELLDHRKIHPFERTTRECTDCGKIFVATEQLLAHQRSQHGLPYPFVCHYCQKWFNSEKCLTEHQTIHTGQKNYSCDKCPSQFHFRIALHRHVKDMHTSEAITCQICSRSYKRRGSLAEHLKTHTGERPWSCDVCGESFVFRPQLKKHMIIHTNERPYLCTACGFSCRLKGNLRAHSKVHEMHRKRQASILKEAESNGFNDDPLELLPVPRLAKPRNRRIQIQKVSPAITAVEDALRIVPGIEDKSVAELNPVPPQSELEPVPIGTAEIEIEFEFEFESEDTFDESEVALCMNNETEVSSYGHYNSEFAIL